MGQSLGLPTRNLHTFFQVIFEVIHIFDPQAFLVA